MSKLYKNRPVIMVAVVAIIIIVIIAVTSMDRERISAGESLVGSVIKPVTGTITAVINSIRNSVTGIAEYRSLRDTNQMLNEQIISLRTQVREMEALKQENQRLREMLDFKDIHSDYDLIGCDIVGKSPDNTSGVFTINKGAQNGVAKNMPVVTSSGLVGQVMDVGSSWAKVLPLNDQRSSVSVLVNRTRDAGILKGNIGFELTGSIPPDAAVVEGDDVVTSGMGGIFPKGLLVGRISRVSTGDSQLLKTIRIEPAVDFNKVEEVFVLKYTEGLSFEGEILD